MIYEWRERERERESYGKKEMLTMADLARNGAREMSLEGTVGAGERRRTSKWTRGKTPCALVLDGELRFVSCEESKVELLTHHPA